MPAIQCVAIIPARGGSKGVPRKNIRLLGGFPLVGRTITAAQNAHSVDSVYVSTDDAEIAEVSKTYGATVIWRPEHLSGDEATSESALLHALEQLALEGVNPETLVFLQCTSPFTSSDDIDAVVHALRSGNAKAALAVTEDHGFLWRIQPDGSAEGVNFDHTRQRQRRQDMQPQYRETGAIYAMNTQAFVQNKTRFCGQVVAVPLVSSPVEIDTEEDFKVAEAILRCGSGEKTTVLVPDGIRVLVTDFDGVHTDDCVYLDENGVESVRCSRSDGYGLERLRFAGIPLLILSKEANPVVTKRALKLNADVIQQSDNKWPALKSWLTENNLTAAEMAYIGNDINDIECLKHAGWSCAPDDAHPLVKSIVDYVSTKKGGQGAIRDIADRLIAKH
jgi:N-acylneuraminate cytidylyltransferase